MTGAVAEGVAVDVIDGAMVDEADVLSDGVHVLVDPGTGTA